MVLSEWEEGSKAIRPDKTIFMHREIDDNYFFFFSIFWSAWKTSIPKQKKFFPFVPMPFFFLWNRTFWIVMELRTAASKECFDYKHTFVIFFFPQVSSQCIFFSCLVFRFKFALRGTVHKKYTFTIHLCVFVFFFSPSLSLHTLCVTASNESKFLFCVQMCLLGWVVRCCLSVSLLSERSESCARVTSQRCSIFRVTLNKYSRPEPFFL